MLGFIKKYFCGFTLDDSTASGSFKIDTSIDSDYEYCKEKYKDSYKLVYDEAKQYYKIKRFCKFSKWWYDASILRNITEVEQAKLAFVKHCLEQARINKYKEIDI